MGWGSQNSLETSRSPGVRTLGWGWGGGRSTWVPVGNAVDACPTHWIKLSVRPGDCVIQPNGRSSAGGQAQMGP